MPGGPYFEGTDAAHLKAHQRAFMAAAFGGPEVYNGKSMAAAHAGLEITKMAFGLVVGHLVATLKELNVSNEVIMQIAAELGPLEPDIVSMAGATT